MRLATLKRRSEYLGVRGGAKWGTPAFLMEGRKVASAVADESEAPPPPRFGFTVTKKLGPAVVRNRIRRRLREAISLELAIATDAAGLAGWRFVVVARPPAFDLPFEAIRSDVAAAIQRITTSGRSQGRGAGQGDRRARGHPDRRGKGRSDSPPER
jgi:ribonuclease P protein component